MDIDLRETEITDLILRKRETEEGYALRFEVAGTVHEVEEETVNRALAAEELHSVEIKVEIEEETPPVPETDDRGSERGNRENRGSGSESR